MSTEPIRFNVRREKINDFLDTTALNGALVITQEHVQLTVGTRILNVGPGYWVANVRLANRARLERLRTRTLTTDPQAVLAILDKPGLCLTISRIEQHDRALEQPTAETPALL
jgi:hypothetical protein